MHELALTADGRVRLLAGTGTPGLLARWLPLNARALAAAGDAGDIAVVGDAAVAHAAGTGDDGDGDVVISVRLAATGGIPAPDADTPRTARIGRTDLHVGTDTARVHAPHAYAVARLAQGRAEVILESEVAWLDVVHAMNFVAALLLARARRWLVHAAAVGLGPDVWLLAGDAFSGKTTTTLNLARAGWRLLSDDHVLLSGAGAAWQVEGWPRMLHIDEGWPDGQSTGRRQPRDPRELPWLRLAPSGRLRGVLLPRVNREATRTAVTRVTSGASLEALLRQSAWSIADAGAAPGTLAALAAVAALPCFRIELAPDTFNDPGLLHDTVLAAIGG